MTSILDGTCVLPIVMGYFLNATGPATRPVRILPPPAHIIEQMPRLNELCRIRYKDPNSCATKIYYNTQTEHMKLICTNVHLTEMLYENQY